MTWEMFVEGVREIGGTVNSDEVEAFGVRCTKGGRIVVTDEEGTFVAAEEPEVGKDHHTEKDFPYIIHEAYNLATYFMAEKSGLDQKTIDQWTIVQNSVHPDLNIRH